MRHAEWHRPCLGRHERDVREKAAPVVRGGDPHVATSRSSGQLDICRVVDDEDFADCPASFQRGLDVWLNDGFGAAMLVIDESVECFQLGVRSHGPWKARARVSPYTGRYLQKPCLTPLVSESGAFKLPFYCTQLCRGHIVR
jgi:hypothetical protein